MRAEWPAVEAYLAGRGGGRSILLFGDDESLVRERARAAIIAVAGSPEHPFRLCTLGRESLDRLAAELSTPSLDAGRRIVHLAGGSDAMTGAVAGCLSGSKAACTLLVTAGGLTARSKLRVLFEQHREAYAVSCPALTSAAAASTFAAALASRGLSADSDAVGWAATRLGTSRDGVDRAAELLKLFVHPRQTVEFGSIVDCVGGGGSADTEAVAEAMATGRTEATDAAVNAALRDGVSPVALVVSALGTMQAIHRGLLLRQRGMSAMAVSEAVRPVLYGRRKASFVAALPLWSLSDAADGVSALRVAELACKQTGMPADLVTSRTIARVAQLANRRRVSGSAAR